MVYMSAETVLVFVPTSVSALFCVHLPGALDIFNKCRDGRGPENAWPRYNSVCPLQLGVFATFRATLSPKQSSRMAERIHRGGRA